MTLAGMVEMVLEAAGATAPKPPLGHKGRVSEGFANRFHGPY
jgi:hypothetical protein